MGVAFRAGVGAVILASDGRVLALERTSIPGAWQLPQGGIEDGEDVVDALWRELGEETALTPGDVDVIGEVPEWLGYELPPGARSDKTGRGQVHRWFVLRARRDDIDVRFGDASGVEFRSWRWMPLVLLAEQAVAFRQPVYRRLVEVVARLGG